MNILSRHVVTNLIITNESLPNTEKRIIVLKNKMRKSKTEFNDRCKCYLYFLLRDTTEGLVNTSLLHKKFKSTLNCLLYLACSLSTFISSITFVIPSRLIGYAQKIQRLTECGQRECFLLSGQILIKSQPPRSRRHLIINSVLVTNLSVSEGKKPSVKSMSMFPALSIKPDRIICRRQFQSRKTIRIRCVLVS